MHRRTFLRRASAGVAAALGVGTLPRRASAAYDHQPEHVTITGYDAIPDEVEQYRPLTVLRALDIEPDALYAWRAESDQHPTTAYSYWCWYSAGQTGLSEQDSHVPDREPIVVFVDADDAVTEVVFDRWHYFVGRVPAPPTYQDTHAKLHVINPWHNLRTTTEGGVYVDVQDLRDRYQAWLEAGWEVHPESVLDPWSVRQRGHWWSESVTGRLEFRLSQLFAGLGLEAQFPAIFRGT